MDSVQDLALTESVAAHVAADAMLLRPSVVAPIRVLEVVVVSAAADAADVVSRDATVAAASDHDSVVESALPAVVVTAHVLAIVAVKVPVVSSAADAIAVAVPELLVAVAPDATVDVAEQDMHPSMDSVETAAVLP